MGWFTKKKEDIKDNNVDLLRITIWSTNGNRWNVDLLEESVRKFFDILESRAQNKPIQVITKGHEIIYIASGSILERYKLFKKDEHSQFFVLYPDMISGIMVEQCKR